MLCYCMPMLCQYMLSMCCAMPCCDNTMLCYAMLCLGYAIRHVAMLCNVVQSLLYAMSCWCQCYVILCFAVRCPRYIMPCFASAKVVICYWWCEAMFSNVSVKQGKAMQRHCAVKQDNTQNELVQCKTMQDIARQSIATWCKARRNNAKQCEVRRGKTFKATQSKAIQG